MLKQYKILTDCLLVLKKSHLPVIDKLRLEVQLIQAKRLLLDQEIGAKVRGVAASESDFRDLLRQIETLCNSTAAEDDGRMVQLQLAKMTEGLRLHQEPSEYLASRSGSDTLRPQLMDLDFR